MRYRIATVTFLLLGSVALAAPSQAGPVSTTRESHCGAARCI